MYDVGAITRELQAEFGLFAPRVPADVNAEPPQNKATPEGLRTLLDALSVVTAEVMEGRNVWGILDEHEVQFDQELLQWRGRLGAYYDAVNAAPVGDRQAVLWGVTAPLLLGYFGGEASDLPQQPIDAATPFILSNMLAVSEAAQARAWDLFLADLEQNARDVIDSAGDTVKIVVGLAVLALVVSLFRR